MEGLLPITASAQEYIDGVLSGTVVAGQDIRKAIERHVADLKRTDIRFDPDAGQYVIDFCEEFCIPSASATPMVLMPWERAFIFILYGWKRLDGTRRFRRAYLEIAKKNGKTGLAAALCCYHLIADGELSARCFVAATALKQAKECFLEAVAMRDKHPELAARISKNGNSPVIALYDPETNSRLSPMTRGSDSQDGAIVSFAVLDELHRWKMTDSLWSILRYGGDTRTQPMLLCITTAGASANKSSLCWGEHEYVLSILNGVNKDDEVFGFIFSLDPKDDIKDQRNWCKPNPSLGYILPLSALINQYKEALGKPTAMGEYKRYRLNIWTDEVSDPAIEIEQWRDCCIEDLSKHPDLKRLRAQLIESLRGKPCYGGCDLAVKRDTSALVLVFPPEKKGEKHKILEYFWCPENDIQERVKRDRVPYDLWAKDGWIVPTGDNITDFRTIAETFFEIAQMFDLKELAYDESLSYELTRMLGESKFPMNKIFPFPQKPANLSPGCYELMRKLESKKPDLLHSGSPLMEWQMRNLRWAKTRNTELIRPAKDRKREKVDGCSALVMALDRACHPDNQLKPKPKFFAVSV